MMAKTAAGVVNFMLLMVGRSSVISSEKRDCESKVRVDTAGYTNLAKILSKVFS